MSNYEIFVYGWIAIGFLSFPFILRYDAPYGRHTSNNWGPQVDNKIGWIVMELHAPGSYTQIRANEPAS